MGSWTLRGSLILHFSSYLQKEPALATLDLGLLTSRAVSEHTQSVDICMAALGNQSHGDLQTLHVMRSSQQTRAQQTLLVTEAFISSSTRCGTKYP